MGFTVIIPARLASTRLPNKPLADLGGKPMVVRVAERARAVGRRPHHRRHRPPRHRGRLRGARRRSLHDAVRPSVRHRPHRRSGARAGAGADDEVVVNLQGDEPLIDPALLAACAARICAGRADGDLRPSADRAPPTCFNPNVVKVVLDKHGPRAVLLARHDPVAPRRLRAVAGHAAGRLRAAAPHRPVRLQQRLPAGLSGPGSGAAGSRSKRSSSCACCGTAIRSRSTSPTARRRPASTRRKTWRACASTTRQWRNDCALAHFCAHRFGNLTCPAPDQSKNGEAFPNWRYSHDFCGKFRTKVVRYASMWICCQNYNQI